MLPPLEPEDLLRLLGRGDLAAERLGDVGDLLVNLGAAIDLLHLVGVHSDGVFHARMDANPRGIPAVSISAPG